MDLGHVDALCMIGSLLGVALLVGGWSVLRWTWPAILFLGFMIAAGLVTGGVLVAAPQVRDFRISPYFWVLIAMALFEFADTPEAAWQSMVRRGLKAHSPEHR